ncbi:MAG: putative dienelactone hydrolase [Cognaticolwellia sp.]|jgi:predicted dienelactone hydrolase
MLIHLLLACASPSDTGDLPPHFDAPDSTGSFTAVTVQDSFTARGGEELTVQIWYPSETSDAGSIFRFDQVYDGQARSQGEAACDQPRPVLMFSHGNGGIRWQSTFFTEMAAAHGYIVVAPDHLGNTFFDMDEVDRGTVALRRPQDISDAFDWAVAQSESGDSAISGCIDPDAGFAVAGHSFGGFTTLFLSGATIDRPALEQRCETDGGGWLCGIPALSEEDVLVRADPRVWAAIPMTPVGALTFDVGLADQSTAILVMGGSEDDLTSMEEQVTPIYEGVGGEPAYLATIEGAGHYSFSVMCDLVPTFNGCGEEFLDAETTKRLINEMSLAFLGQERGFETDGFLPAEGPVVWSE